VQFYSQPIKNYYVTNKKISQLLQLYQKQIYMNDFQLIPTVFSGRSMRASLLIIIQEAQFLPIRTRKAASLILMLRSNLDFATDFDFFNQAGIGFRLRRGEGRCCAAGEEAQDGDTER